uniref:Uncharacterized protein n=1 Tax=Anguilla anguilla TaxID=7936 RepID=A0A0E9W9V9_ANGAN
MSQIWTSCFIFNVVLRSRNINLMFKLQPNTLQLTCHSPHKGSA